MHRTRIVLALTDRQEMHKLKAFLTASGFDIVDECQDGASAIRRIRTLRPELIVVDYELPALSGMEIAKIAEEDAIAPTIIVKGQDQGNILLSPGDDWEFNYLYRPITKAALLQTIHLVRMNYHKVVKLEQEVRHLRDTLETRKLIEKAKGILMRKYDIDEQEAYRRVQKQSMDKGMSMKELSLAIVVASEV